MQADITNNLAALADICRRYGVARLEVFGSAARDDFDPARSDADFLVTFQPAVRNDIGALDDLKGHSRSFLAALSISSSVRQSKRAGTSSVGARS
jgi:predicted nucleotidyltransferase